MSEELFLDKGSKRRVDRIHWKVFEVVSLIALGLGLTALSVFTALWMMSHPVD